MKNLSKKKLVFKSKLKKNDQVICISGKNKGKTGKVININLRYQKAIVEGLNKTQKFIKSKKKDVKTEKIYIERPIHLSNLLFYDSALKKGVRLSYLRKDGKKIRINKKNNKEV